VIEEAGAVFADVVVRFSRSDTSSAPVLPLPPLFTFRLICAVMPLMLPACGCGLVVVDVSSVLMNSPSTWPNP